jgi:hypothetical protein
VPRETFIRRVINRLSGIPPAAPAMPENPIYSLCAEYDCLELWARYHTFRMNPCSKTWKALRRQPVAWIRGQKLATLVAPFIPNKAKTPDVDTVSRTLLTFRTSSRKS